MWGSSYAGIGTHIGSEKEGIKMLCLMQWCKYHWKWDTTNEVNTLGRDWWKRLSGLKIKYFCISSRRLLPLPRVTCNLLVIIQNVIKGFSIYIHGNLFSCSKKESCSSFSYLCVLYIFLILLSIASYNYLKKPVCFLC